MLKLKLALYFPIFYYFCMYTGFTCMKSYLLWRMRLIVLQATIQLLASIKGGSVSTANRNSLIVNHLDETDCYDSGQLDLTYCIPARKFGQRRCAWVEAWVDRLDVDPSDPPNIASYDSEIDRAKYCLKKHPQ